VDDSFWIALAAGAVLAAGYLLVMRVLYRQSKAADQRVDFTKIKPLEDDERDR
jgi:hypothetical protein